MAIAYFGKASTPADAGSNSTSPTVVTPPSSMTAGQLVIVQCMNRLNGDTHDVSETGGQSWTKLSTVTNTLITTTWFYCVFDGTWDANPSFSHGGTNNTCMMLVFTPSTGNGWAVDVEEAPTTGSAPGSPYDVTVTGITCASASVMIVGVASRDDNTWALQSGGATMPAGCSVNNMAGSDSGMLMAYKLMPSGGDTTNQVIRQTANAGDIYSQNILSFKEEAVKSPISGNTGTFGFTNAGIIKGRGKLQGGLTVDFTETANLGQQAPPVSFTLTATGTGAGVGEFRVMVSDNAEFTLNNNGYFYSDEAGTLDESQSWIATPGALRTIYFRVASGSSTLTWLSAGNVTAWGSSTYHGFYSPTNAPSISGAIDQLPEAVTVIRFTGNNSLSGSIDKFTGLTHFYAGGTNTLSCTNINIFTSCIYFYESSITADINGTSFAFPNSITNITIRGTGTVSGDVTNYTALTVLFVTCLGTITGDISSHISLTSLRLNTGTHILSGDLGVNNVADGIVTYFELNPCGMTAYTAGATFENVIITINPSSGYGYSRVDIDNMLADMANSGTLASKLITLQGSNAPRTQASDSAVATLEAGGNTVLVNGVVRFMSGSADITFTQTPNLKGRGKLSGSPLILFSESVNINGRGKLSSLVDIAFSETANLQSAERVIQRTGEAQIQFSESAVIKGRGKLSGQANILFTQQAALKGKGKLRGSVLNLFTESAVLKGRGNLSGSTQITFTPVSDLNGVGRLYNGIGNPVQLSFSQTGIIFGRGSEIGSLSIQFSSSGLLKGNGKLSGSANLAFSELADLNYVLSPGEIRGSTTIQFQYISLLKGKGKLSGSCPVAFSENVKLSGLGLIHGSLAIAFSQSANIQSGGTKLFATGLSSFGFTDSGQLKGKGRLSGEIIVSATVSGIIGGIGRLTGMLGVSFDLIADLVEQGAARGVSNMAFDLNGNLRLAKLRYEKIEGNSYITVTLQDQSAMSLVINSNSGITELIESNSLIKESYE